MYTYGPHINYRKHGCHTISSKQYDNDSYPLLLYFPGNLIPNGWNVMGFAFQAWVLNPAINQVPVGAISIQVDWVCGFS